MVTFFVQDQIYQLCKVKVDPHDSTIEKPNKEVLLVNLWTGFSKPSLAIVEGNVYAGGYLFLACCTYVIADKSLKFSLHETKNFSNAGNGSFNEVHKS